MKKITSKLNFKFSFTVFVSICFLLLTVTLKAYAQKDYKVIQQRLNQIIDSSYEIYKVPGIIASVWMPGFEFKKVIGKSDLKTGVEEKFDDKVRIGSITKTFTATVILQLIDEGKLSLEDKLSKFYPDVPNASEISIRQMLNMTSGLGDYVDESTFVTNVFYNDRLLKVTHPQVLDIIISLKPHFNPGKDWKYSNNNYYLLGMIIEKITGNKLGDEINSRILNPLRLINTSFPVGPYMSGQYNHGYMRDSAGVLIDVTDFDPSLTWAAGGMISNADDLKIWAEALADGKLLSKQTQEQRLEMITIPGGEKSDMKYGLGITSINGFMGHNGGIPGYNSSMYYNPAEKAGFIVLVNELGAEDGASDKIFFALSKVIYPE